MPAVKINEQQKEQAIKAVVGIAVFIFCYLAMISPVLRDIAFFHQSIRNSQKRIELYRQIRALKDRLDNNESVLATLTERPELLGRISDIAGRNQIRVQTLTPRTEADGEYVRLKIEMDGQASFFSLIKFLQAAEKIGSGIKVKDVSMLWQPPPNPKEGKYALQIHLVFETLLKQRAQKDHV